MGTSPARSAYLVTILVQLLPGTDAEPAELISYTKGRIGSVKASKDVLIWDDLPRSKVGKVLKNDIKAALRP